MKIGNTIRKYRKEKGLTQEELATRLGVTAPAVNKWENDNSYPDIALLAPITRLLGISLDTLFSFQEDLTQEEINALILEADQRFKTSDYDEVFLWIKSKLETYPNCLMLIWQFSTLLDAQRLLKPIPNASKYDSYILNCYNRVLQSEDETLRTQAADSLFSYYLRNEEYDTAKKYLTYYSLQNPQRKLKQAIIYSKTGQLIDAYKTFEELLFSEYQILSITLQHLYLLSIEENDFPKAHLYTDKQQALAKLFEMGKYHEVSCKLELATAERDVDTVLDIMETLLDSLDDITGFCNSALYEHMNFQQASPSFLQDLKNDLLHCFQDDSTYDFLKENERYKRLYNKSNS